MDMHDFNHICKLPLYMRNIILVSKGRNTFQPSHDLVSSDNSGDQCKLCFAIHDTKFWFYLLFLAIRYSSCTFLCQSFALPIVITSLMVVFCVWGSKVDGVFYLILAEHWIFHDFLKGKRGFLLQIDFPNIDLTREILIMPLNVHVAYSSSKEH